MVSFFFLVLAIVTILNYKLNEDIFLMIVYWRHNIRNVLISIWIMISYKQYLQFHKSVDFERRYGSRPDAHNQDDIRNHAKTYVKSWIQIDTRIARRFKRAPFKILRLLALWRLQKYVPGYKSTEAVYKLVGHLLRLPLILFAYLSQ